MPSQTVLPRYRGFNLPHFVGSWAQLRFGEVEFRWIAEWGFDFVRIPMDYHVLILNHDITRINEALLENLDQGVLLAEKYGLHLSLNLHRAPGYCINPGGISEPYSLWRSEEAVEAFCFLWQMFSKRYHGISGQRMSFDLVNEPPTPAEDGMTRADYERVVGQAVAAIREIDGERLIFAEGMSIGNEPCPELVSFQIAQSCRAYIPMGLSHYQAPWAPGGERYPEPVWPGAIHEDGKLWDRACLEAHYERWGALARQGVGVHCGEGGCHIKTPHPVFLAWFRDVLEILTYHNIGYSLWELSGPFGIMDSGRQDVDYEDWRGHKLDQKLLELLREF